MAVPFLACVFTHLSLGFMTSLSLSCSLFILKQTLKRKKKFTGKNTSPHEGLESFTTYRGLPAVLCTERTQILALGLPPSLRSKGCWGGERCLSGSWAAGGREAVHARHLQIPGRFLGHLSPASGLPSSLSEAPGPPLSRPSLESRLLRRPVPRPGGDFPLPCLFCGRGAVRARSCR